MMPLILGRGIAKGAVRHRLRKLSQALSVRCATALRTRLSRSRSPRRGSGVAAKRLPAPRNSFARERTEA